MATLDILINARDNASSALNDVGDSLDKLNRKTTGIDAAFGNLQKTVSVGVVGAVTAMGAALAGTTAVIADGVGKAANLEQGVADIAAVMGLATDEVAPLKDLIQELGMDPMLKVNATEASDAIMQLAQSGISMTDILDGAARNVVLLSNATGGDMALSAAIASDAMALFNISAEGMEAAVNQITGVTVASKFGIQDYQFALAAVGGVASTLGVSFEDLNTTIAAISPSFASGSDAGTSLKTMLTRLIPSSDDAAQAMRQIGLFSGMTSDEMDRAKKEAEKLREQIANLDPTSADYARRAETLNQRLQNVNASMVAGQNAFFNADGSMKSMSQISGILQNALSGLSDEQRTATLETIFGSDAIRAASALATTGSAEFDRLAASIGQVDAGGSAATRMNTFSGAMEVLQGVLDGVLIGIGDAFLPLLRSLVEMFTGLASTHGPSIIKMFRDVADQLTATGQWLAEFVRTGNLLNTAIVNVNPNIQRMASFVSGAVEPVRSLMQQITNLLIEQGYWKDILIALGVILAVTVIPALVTLVATMAPVIAVAAAVVAAVRLLREAFETNFGGIRDFVENVSRILIITYNNIRDGTWSLQEGVTMAFRGIVFQIQQYLPLWISILSEWATAIWKWIVDATPTVVAKLGEWGGRLITWLGENLPGWLAKLGEWATAIVSWIGESIPKAIRSITDFVQGVSSTGDAEGKSEFPALVSKWMASLIDWIRNDLIPQVGPKMLEFLKAFSTVAVSIATELARLGGTLAVSLIFALAQGLLDLAGIPVNLESLKQQVFTILNGAIDTVRGIATNIINAIATGIANGSSGVSAAANAIWQIISDTFGLQGKLDQARQWGANLFGRLRDGIATSDGTVRGAATAIWNVINNEFGVSARLTEAYNWGANLIGSLSRGVTEFNLDGITDYVSRIWRSFRDRLSVNEFINIGNVMMDGLNQGIMDKIQWLTQNVLNGLNWIIDQIRLIFRISSPSRVMADIGENLMLGMEIGMLDNIPAVVAAARLMAAGVMGVANEMSLSPQMALSAATMGASANGNIMRPSVTYNATYNLSYTMQSAGSVQQDIELLNLLYGGQL